MSIFGRKSDEDRFVRWDRPIYTVNYDSVPIFDRDVLGRIASRLGDELDILPREEEVLYQEYLRTTDFCKDTNSLMFHLNNQLGTLFEEENTNDRIMCADTIVTTQVRRC